MQTDNRGIFVVLVLGLLILLALGPCATPTPPQPPQPPPPVDPQTTGPVYLLIFRRATELTIDQATTLIKLRTWTDARPETVSHLEFPPEAAAEDERVAAYAAKIPPGALLPYCFASRAAADGSGARILWHGPLPATLPELASIVERILQP